jgi:hypothetical protein
VAASTACDAAGMPYRRTEMIVTVEIVTVELEEEEGMTESDPTTADAETQ